MGYRLLLVDDESSILSTLKSVFESQGHSVLTASSVAQAASLLKSGSFDVVLTDMKMETDTAGFDVARAAKAQAYKPAVLILSAYPVLAQQWRQVGVDAIVQKPTGVMQLLEAVEKLAGASRKI